MAQLTFAEYVRSQHIRLSELARDAGIKRVTTLYNWRDGNVLLPLRSNVKVVAEKLGVSVDDLFVMIEEGYYRKHPESRPPDLPLAA